MRTLMSSLCKTATMISFLLLFINIGLEQTASAQNYDLTMDVLVNSQNATGYNTDPSSPGEYQRYPERYLEHLQIPYRVIDTATQAPPSNLGSIQLIVAAHKGLNLSPAWQQAILQAVQGGTGFVNLDSDPSIGSNLHMQTIFGATGSAAGTPATQIDVPSSVMPDGSSPHYIAGLQLRFTDTPPGDLIYTFHLDDNRVQNTATPTVLQGPVKGTVIAYLGSAPLIIATQTSGGRAVDFATYDYMRPDRFGFMMGLDDLFWRSLVWAARKPFIVRGYPHFYASQMDDEVSGWGTRLQDLWNTTYTGTVNADGTGGPWKITANIQLQELQPGGVDRTAGIADVATGNLQMSLHTFTGISQGDMFWNPQSPNALTDAQWSTNLATALQDIQGNGGADTLPRLSKDLIPHFWNLSNNVGYDIWHSFGARYLNEIQQPGAYYSYGPPKPASMRLFLHPFRVYELPPTYGDPNESWPIYYADDLTVGSRAGLPPVTFFAFCTQLLGDQFPSFDARWPNDGQGISVQESVDNFTEYAWRFWSGMAPVQIYNHDGGSFANSTEPERQQAITQISAFLNAHGVRHLFMEDLGAYLRARVKSVLSSAEESPTQLTLNFSGSATDMDGNPVATYLYVYYGDDEGVMLQVPGFTNGTTWTTPNVAPSRIGLSNNQLTFGAYPGGQASSQLVTVSNTGSGTLSYTTQSNASWLTVNPGNGTAPQGLTITADPTGLAAGTYTGVVSVQAAGAINSPQQIGVTFNIAPPTLVASPSSLAFSGYVGLSNPASQEISISNQGGGTINWTASSNASWLQVSSTSGTAPSVLNVSINASGLMPGTYSGAITVSSSGANGSPQSIPVTLSMTGILMQSSFASGTLAGWAYSPLGLASNWSISNSTLSYNGGGQTQVYAGNSNWQDYTVQTSFLLSSLSDYPGGIRARINPSTGASYAAWIYPAEGVIKLWRTSTWNINTSPTQLAVSAHLTMDSINWHTVALSVSGSQLTVLYDGNAVITATDATLSSGMIGLDVSNKPISFQNVMVTSNQATTTALTMNPSSLNFNVAAGATSSAQTLQVGTNDSAIVAWSASASSSWLNLATTNGPTPGSTAITVNATSLAPGSYTATVSMISLGTTNTTTSIPVAVTVAPVANLQLSVTPGTLAFSAVSGTTPTSQMVSVQSSGSSLSYSTSSDSPWLSASPASGTTTSSIQINADATKLAAGSYSGNITVTAPAAQNSPIVIPVTLQVAANALVGTPSALSFVGAITANAPAQTLLLTTSVGNAVAWISSSRSSWFASSPGSGSTPGTLQASVNNIGMASGNYADTLTITPTNATAISALAIPISLRVGSLLFSDNFSNGTASNWTASPMGLSSGWSVVNGAYQYNGGGATQQYAGSGTWTDYTLQADMTLTSASNYPGGIRARVNLSTGSGYAVWLYPGSSTLKLFRVKQWNIDGSGTVTLATKTGIPIAVGTHHLRVDVKGSTITVFLDNVQMMAATDSTYTTGAIALDVSNKVVSYTNISVVSY
ncbi:MAG: BACON domain-containing protein [Acidobacteriaceae bacterium]